MVEEFVQDSADPVLYTSLCYVAHRGISTNRLSSYVVSENEPQNRHRAHHVLTLSISLHVYLNTCYSIIPPSTLIFLSPRQHTFSPIYTAAVHSNN